jgi:hypothetical protein
MTSEFEQYARDCVRLAWQTQDQAIRAQLLEMARNWMALVVADMMPKPPTSVSRRRKRALNCSARRSSAS